jgi:hypothetical protein
LFKAGFFKGLFWGVFGSVLTAFIVWPHIDNETKNRLVKSSYKIKTDASKIIQYLKEIK